MKYHAADNAVESTPAPPSEQAAEQAAEQATESRRSTPDLHPPQAPARPNDRSVAPGRGAAPVAMPSDRPFCRYVVQRELGRGGMGTVEEVIDRLTGERLALKRLQLHGVSPKRHGQVLTLFQQEFHVLSHLNHPRIVRVRDYGQDAIGPYYTMELLDGRDLHGLGVMPWRRACRIARDVVSSLAIVHGRRYVHRDVTPRNIRVDVNGDAKLLDFGAMTPAGVHAAMVGTPPFIPPEAVQQVGLDGRADLFSLGATLYWCLTGRHAYPARSVGHLLDAWRSPPRSPRHYNADIPGGLDTLVMELLHISPMARPPNAAVVFERLLAIADLPRDEALQVSASYLVSSTLIGREEVLGKCRSSLLASMRGRGRSLLITGAVGSGRSRVVDAVVLEAKMLGALVLRADNCDTSDNFALLRRLADNLASQRPTLAARHAALQSLLSDERIANDQRDAVYTGFSTLIRGLSTTHHVVVAVDDLDRVDEPSLACLASLASQRNGLRLLMVSTARKSAQSRSEAAMQLLQDASRTYPMPPLDHAQSQDVLRSIFGDAENLSVVADVLFRRSRGNPGKLLRDAQLLADAGLVRYGAGAWTLPSSQSEFAFALPPDPSLQQRLARLPCHAREIVDLIALDSHGHIRLKHCSALLDNLQPAVLHDALEALESANIVRRSSDGTGQLILFDREDTQQALSEPGKALAHRRLAGWYKDTEFHSAYAHHGVYAGHWDVVAQRVLTTPIEQLRAEWRHDPTALHTLEQLVEHTHSQQPNTPERLPLRTKLLALAVDTENWVCVIRHAEQTMAELAERCGLNDYADTSGPSEADRLSEAIARSEQRHSERLEACGLDASAGLSLLDALQELPAVILTAASASVLAVAPNMTEAIPSLTPLFSLSPAFPIVEQLAGAIIAVSNGEIARGLDLLRVTDAQLAEPAPGLEPHLLASLVDFCSGFLQGIESTIAADGVLERSEKSERRSKKRAERERYAYYNAIGDTEQAIAARRRLERLEVQGGSLKQFPSTWETEYSLHSLTENVEGLKRCEQQARQVAKQIPGWAPRVELASIAQAQCGACTRETIERAQRLMLRERPGTSHRRYALYLLTDALVEVGDYARCLELIHAEIERLGRAPQWHEGYLLTLAESHAHLGNHAQAKKCSDEHLAMYLAAGVGGILLGRTYELAARIALLGGDEPRFIELATRCANLYRNGFNPTLSVRYERLMLQARELKFAVSDELKQAAQFPERTPVSALLSNLRTELSTYVEPDHRYQRALKLLVRGTGAAAGVLYLASNPDLQRAAITGEANEQEALEGSLGSTLDEHTSEFWSLETMDIDTGVVDQTQVTPSSTPGVGHHNVQLGTQTGHLFLLSDAGATCERACGVLVLIGDADTVVAPNHHALTALAQLLLEEKGVIGHRFD